MPKLRRAGMVSTKRLLGHTLDHNTSKLIVPLCNTFYENMTNLSRFWRKFCACHRHHLLDVPSLQRTMLYTNSPQAKPASSTCRRVECSMAHYRAMRSPFTEINTAAFAVRTPLESSVQQ